MTDGWTALAESTGRLPGLALNLAQLQQQGQHMRALEADFQKRLALEGQRVDIERINAGRQKDLYDVQKREANIKLKTAERDTELIPVSETLASVGVKRPAEQQFFMNYAGPYIQKGPASGLPSIQRNHAQEIYGKLLKDVDANIKLDSIRAQEAQKEIAAIDAQMTNPETSGKLKPDQVAQLQKQRADLVTERTIADNSVRRLTREKGKESLKNFWDPAKQTWIQKNIVTDDVTGLIPEEVRKTEITAAGLNKRAEEANKTRLEAAKISAAGKARDMAPIGNIRAVTLNLAAKYLPLAKRNMGDDAEKLSEGLFMTDQFGRNVNEARLRTYLTPEQQKAYDWIKIEGERLSKTKTPAAAVDIAIKNYYKTFSGGATPKMGGVKGDTERKDAESAIAAGKDAAAVKALYKKRTGKAY